MSYLKLLLLCIAVPIILLFLLLFFLPFLLIFALVCAFAAPSQFKNFFQKNHIFRKRKKPAEKEEIDIEYTVLNSQEIDPDS